MNQDRYIENLEKDYNEIKRDFEDYLFKSLAYIDFNMDDKKIKNKVIELGKKLIKDYRFDK